MTVEELEELIEYLKDKAVNAPSLLDVADIDMALMPLRHYHRRLSEGRG